MINHRRILALALVIALTGASCKKNTVTSTVSRQPVTLTMWEIYDQPEAFDNVIRQYQTLHPNITILVKTLPSYENYRVDVSNGIAANNGPDIWEIRNDWLPQDQDKLMPMPEGLLSGSTKTTNVQMIGDRYPSTVTTDAIYNNKAYGIPLSIDTLALYYNKDHFQEAGITTPPANWSEFAAMVPKLTKYSDNAHTQITRAGAAIGSNNYLNRATDIMMLLMMQTGSKMVSDDHQSALFNGQVVKKDGSTFYPGVNALDFYTSFADPKKAAFTWQSSVGNDVTNGIADSVDAFAKGKVSMIFSYAYMGRNLLQRNPNLNYGVAPMPQIQGSDASIDYPTYWLQVVSRNTQHPAEAWDFMKFLSESGDSIYQTATSKPPAKKNTNVVTPTQRLDAMSQAGAPWVFQTSTATDWYRGKNSSKIEQIFGEMIENVVTFHQTPQVAVDNAANLVTKVLQGNDS